MRPQMTSKNAGYIKGQWKGLKTHSHAQQHEKADCYSGLNTWPTVKVTLEQNTSHQTTLTHCFEGGKVKMRRGKLPAGNKRSR